MTNAKEERENQGERGGEKSDKNNGMEYELSSPDGEEREEIGRDIMAQAKERW